MLCVSILLQVNAGPMAYARAFLDDRKSNQFGNKKVKDLKDIFRYVFLDCFIFALLNFESPKFLQYYGIINTKIKIEFM